MKKITISAALAVIGLASAAPLAAQDGYFFGAPRVSLTLRAGAAGLAASGVLFQTITDQLTLDRSDFVAGTFGAEVAVRALPRVDVFLNVATSHSSDISEFRDFLETNDEPIRQTTELTRTPLTGGLKIHLLPRGRSISRYAFVPNKFSPYVGGGAGVMFWTLRQDGDFVDFETLDIFTDHLEESGHAFTANAFAGGDVWVAPRIGINIEGRYNWANSNLVSYAYSDFEEIDLKGWQLTAGVTFRY